MNSLQPPRTASGHDMLAREALDELGRATLLDDPLFAGRERHAIGEAFLFIDLGQRLDGYGVES